MRRVTGLAVLMVLALAATAAVAEKKPEQFSELKFTILKDDNGKPVRNASVVLHVVDKDGKQDKSGAQLKTDAEGHTQFPAVPYGKMRVQVIASGFQTFGDDYDINQPTQEITIKLKRPQKQFSIYDK